MVASVDIVNQSLEAIGAQTTIAALNDGSVAGNAAGILYTPAVGLLLRQMGPDFARRRLPLVPQTGGSPPPALPFEYVYPSDCLRLRRLAPAGYVLNDPGTVRGSVSLDVIMGVSLKVIFAPIASVIGVYTSSQFTENQWDASFVQAVVKLLAHPLSMALAGRPDFAKELLEEAARFEQMAELVDESMV